MPDNTEALPPLRQSFEHWVSSKAAPMNPYERMCAWEAWQQSAALAQRQQVPELWVVVRESALDVGRGDDVRTGGRPELGYALIANATTFASKDEAAAAIRTAGLPVGWVYMPLSRLLPDLHERINSAALTAAPSAQAEPQVPLTDEQIDGLRGLDTASRVRFYEHDFYVLSNFSAFNLQWKGLTFPTSEHAYHWEKFAPHYTSLRDHLQSAPSAHEAFKLAECNRHYRREDWDDVKVGIMLDILREKARQHEYVRRKLLATGDRELVEDSWRDDFWGWGPNRDGKNMLGTLWMQVRAELREQDQ